MKGSQTSGRRQSHLLVLEPRMMFDGAAVVTAATTIAPDALAGASKPVPYLNVSDSDALVSNIYENPVAAEDGLARANYSISIEPTDDDGDRVFADGLARQSPDMERGRLIEAFWQGRPQDRDGMDRVRYTDMLFAVDESGLPEVTDQIGDSPSGEDSNVFIFIDQSVAGYEALAAEWQGRGTIIFIDPGADGIDQIMTALAGQSNIETIHIVSHGDDGVFWLGSTRVDQAAVTGELAASLAAIGAKLNDSGDILIYGCNVGDGPQGQALVDSISLATGADVAASIDDTGSTLRGGDWTLEHRLGAVESASLVAREWEGLLAPSILAVSTTTVLTVRDGNGNVVVIPAGGESPNLGAGAVARWTNAGTVNGQAVDVVATVVSLSSGDAFRFIRSGTNGVGADDFGLRIARGSTTGTGTAVVRWDVFLAGTTTPAVGDISFGIADLDGVGGATLSREWVSVNTDTLASYQSAGTTNIRFINAPGSITASGTQDELADPPLAQSAARFNWANTSSVTLTYNLSRAVVTTATFSHDGDGDLNLGTGGVTVSIPRLDLDANNSTATGSNYSGSYIENGSGVSIVDSDISVSNPLGSVQTATIRLTNAQAGDVLSVGALPTGITATTDTSVAGQITVTLTGGGTAAQYQTALRAVTFSNSTDRPATVDRNITVGFANSTLNSNVATSTIRVTEVNDLPVAVNDTARTGAEDTSITGINVLANDIDLDGDTLTVTTATATNGAVTIGAGGVLTYTPNANYNGTDTITYTISDGRGGTSTATIPITVTAVNDAPLPVGMLPARNNVDGATGISVATATAFADVDGPAATYSATGLPLGLSINASTGEITGTINRSASQTAGGVYTVIVTRSDSSLSATQSFSWTVTNPAPSAVNDSATTAEDTPVTINLLANDSDPDGDPLTITSAAAANGTVTIGIGGQVTYTPNANFSGIDTITYAISDGQGGTATATAAITVTAVNDAPVRVGTLPARTNADAQAGINVATAGAFSDVDNASLTYSATDLPVGLTINTVTGVISGTIDRSASQGGAGGIYSVVVTARDTAGLTATQSFSWTVTNPAPVAANDTASTNEDTAVTITVLGNDSDPDGDPLTVTSASAANGTVIVNANGTITFTPRANFDGTDTISYTISDGQGGTSTGTVTVTIAAVNDAPVAVGQLPPQASNDGAAGISVATAGSFSDVDNASLTYSATGLPAGLSINGATGVVTGTIDRSASQTNGGSYTVTVTARDASGLAATQSFSWTVTNPVPVAVNDSVATNEDTPVLISVLPNDSDPDGDPLALIAAAASVGQATIVGNQINYVPPANFNGTATITYRISDGQGGTATATVTVTVNPVNDAPISTPIPAQQTSDGAPVSVPVAGNFSDIDGNALSFAATGLPPGLSIDPATGVISGIVSANASQTNGGVYTATISASDGNGGTVNQTINFTVANPSPVATNDTASTLEDTLVTINVLANDSDPDGDRLTVTSASAANGTVTINANGTLTYTPNPGFNGSDTITYQISDGNGGMATATVTVAVADVNDVPISSTIANQANLDRQSVNLPVAGAFGDPDGDTLTYSATGLPAGLSLNAATGVITGTIDRSASQANGGVYSVNVTANDGRGGTASTTFSWTVTNPGPAAANDSVLVAEDSAVNIPLLANDVDPDGDPLRVTSATAANGAVSINADGSLLYTPRANFNGTDTIFYSVTDSEGGVSTASVTVTVTPVNDAPTTVGLPNQNGDDGNAVSIPTASAFSDIDGDTLTFSATGLPPNTTIDPSTGLITGILAPESSQNGPYIVTVTATDPSGVSVSTQFIFSIQESPPVAVNDSATTPEDVPVTVAVLTNDSDPDGDPLTITAATANNGTVVINGNGTLTFTPAANFNGIATISYTVSDGGGGIATATLTIDVTPVNDAPTALTIPDQVNVDGGFFSGNAAAFFNDVDGDTLTYSLSGQPAGITIDPVTGLVSGQIAANASQVNGGIYTITVSATDGNGGTVSTTFTGTVTNPASVAANDSATTNEDVPVAIQVLGNDSDPDGDTLSVTVASAINGSVAIGAGGILTYTPDANFNGTDTITYTISDGQGGTSTATVTVTVNPLNDAPVTVDDVASTNEDMPVTLGVLGNDSDVDGDALTIAAASSPNGTVVVNPDGTLTFTPNANFNGSAMVNYAISDGNGGTSIATVSVTVVSVNDAPVANPSAVSTNEDTSVVVAVLANDSDVDGDALIVTAASAPNGTVTINADGTVNYTPNANFNGTDTISYTISDGNGGMAMSTVTVTVLPANDAPTVTPVAPQRDDDGAAINLAVAGNFSDLDRDTLTFSATGLPPGLIISAAGLISGTISANASQISGGVYSVTVTATDGNGGTVTTIFGWTVVNPAPVAVNDSVSTDEDVPVTIGVLANDNDPDGDPLTVTSATSPNGVAAIDAGGTITFTPAANFNGPATITYTISDGNGGTSTATVTVNVVAVNDAPAVDTPLPNSSGVDGASEILQMAGSFSDLDGDTLSFSATGLPAGLTINAATGVISGTVDRSASQGGANGDGVYLIIVTASDGNGGIVSSDFTYTVTNPPPVAVNNSATTAEDTPVTITPLGNDTDPDGDPLIITSATAPNGSVIINPDGSLSYTPNRDFNGTDFITYSTSDGQGGTSTATVIVTVTPVNDAPVVISPLPDLANRDGEAGVSVSSAQAFADVDDASLTYSATGLPPGLSIDPATGIVTGTISSSASQANGGIYLVSITATDSGGLQTTAQFSWAIANLVQTAVNDVASTTEDTPTASIAVLTNDNDPDGDPLTVISATAPNGSVVINADGTLVYTPGANFNGTDIITYTTSDGNGGTATATVTVTIVAANDAPVTDAPLSSLADQDGDIVNISVAGNFSDIDGDTLIFSAAGLPPGLSIDAAGVVSGTIAPNASQSNGGVYSVTVTASDGNGGAATSTFNWVISNPPPVAVDDSAVATEDLQATIAVLANDTDPDGDTLSVISASAQNGTVTINADGTITYTPNADFNGPDTITYTISDGQGGTSQAIVAVVVGAVNDAPRTNGLPDLFDLDNDNVTIPVGSAFSDPEGSVLAFSATGLPAGISIDPVTGVISGTLAPTASAGGAANDGVYTVTVTADDGNGGITSTTFTWTIDNVGPRAVDDSFTTAEDVPVTIAVLANDTDPDLDPLTIVSATATNGLVIVNGDGTLTFTPDLNFNGTATVSYLITDGNGGFSTATATITIIPTGDAPDARPLPDQRNLDGEAVSLFLAGAFSDADGDTLTYSAANLPAGLSINNLTGEITGTIAVDASQPNGGVYIAQITASDGALSTTQTFVWEVSNVVPVAAADTATTDEDVPVDINVLANDNDPDGDPLTISFATAVNGTVTIGVGGVLTYIPDANFSGTDTITYTISDGNGGTAQATVAVTVNAVNDAPTASPLPALSNIDSAVILVPVAGNFADLDGDTLTFTATGLPAGLSIDAAGVIRGTLSSSSSQGGVDGVYTVTVIAADGNGGTVSTSFSWTITNPGPVAANDSVTTSEDTPVAITVLANDSDPDGDPLTATTASAGSGTVTIAGGVITYTPNADFNGTDIVTYTISDGNGGTDTATVTVTITPVNDAPVVGTIPDQFNVDGGLFTGNVAPFFSDIDSDTLTYGATGLPAGLSIDPATGIVSGRIAAGASQVNGGIYTITVTASDGNGGTASTTFTGTVTNPAPVATDDSVSAAEDTLVNIAVLANDNDPDGDALTITAASAANGSVVILADGTLDYTPNADFNGVDTITYSISDGQGGSSTAAVTVTVGPANDPPGATGDAASTDEEVAVTIAVLANDIDIDGDPLIVSAATAPNGSVTINADGTVTYTPNANFNGTDTITYTVSDGQGGFDTATVTVIVRPINDAPIAAADSAATSEDTPVSVAVLANDSDADGDSLEIISATSPDGQVTINPDGSITFAPNANFTGTTTVSYTVSDGRGGTATAVLTLTVSSANDAPVATASTATTDEDVPVTIPVLANDSDVDGDSLTVILTSAANGTVVINPDGTLTYTPDANFNGTDILSYTISDGRGGFASGTVTVTVNALNDAPVAANDVAVTEEDQPVTIAVLANDRDADGNPLTITAASSPNGTVVINPDGTLDFTPAPDFNGAATISYTISDGNGGTATASVTVTVGAVNDSPIARPDSATTAEDTALRLLPLANDSDTDGNPLAIISASAPNGIVVINPDGSLTYTPDANFSGTDIISYQISDGQGGFATATISVTVIPVNDPPIAANDGASTDENVPVRIPVLANDNDVESNPLTVTAASAPNGAVTINADGTITYTPRAGFGGTDTVTYTISDGNGGTATATVAVTVRDINNPPVDGDENIFAIGGSPTIIEVLANAVDPGGDPLSLFFAETDIGTVVINADGTLTFTAPAAFQGVATIRYIVSDGQGGFDASTVTITVTQANADVNALLGSNGLEFPEGLDIDRSLTPFQSYVTTPLVILDAVNDFRGLRGIADLNVGLPVLTAVNAFDWLKGTETLDIDGSPVNDVIRQLDQIRDLRFGADRFFDPRFGDFALQTFTGFSVRQLDSGNDQIMIDSVVRDRVIYMEVRDVGDQEDSPVVRFELRSRNGSPLPDWVRMDARGLAIIERPVDAEEIRLIVRAVRADGEIIDIPVILQGATGEIELDTPIAGKKIGAAETLSQKLATTSASVSSEAAQLAAAFSA